MNVKSFIGGLIAGAIGILVLEVLFMVLLSKLDSDRDGEYFRIQSIRQRYNHFTNFDKVPYAKNGDVFIAPFGRYYHYKEDCEEFLRPNETMRVNSSDAERAGFKPCCDCQNNNR